MPRAEAEHLASIPTQRSDVGNSSSVRQAVHPVRWHMLAIYMCLGLVNQALWLSFAPVPAATARRYGVELEDIAVMTNSCNLFYLPGSWLGMRLLRKRGLRKMIFVACWLQLIGCFLRWVADAFARPVSAQLAFGLLFVGQGITSLASPLIMNTPAVFADAWFAKGERDHAVAAGTLSPIFGQGVGSAVAGFVVTGHEAQGTGQLLAGQVLFSCAVAAWTFSSFREPPCPAAIPTTGESDQSSTCAAAWKLLRRPHFMMILLVFNTGLGLAAAVLTLAGQITEPCGYSGAVAGAASGLFMLGGILGSVAAGALLGATRAYRAILRGTVGTAVSFGFLWLVALRPDNLLLLLAATSIFGASMLSALPALITNAVEETFPVAPDVSTTLLFVSAIVTQILFIPLAQFVVERQGGSCSSWGSPFCLFTLGVAVLGALLPALAYRGQNNRMLAEMGAQSELLPATSGA